MRSPSASASPPPREKQDAVVRIRPKARKANGHASPSVQDGHVLVRIADVKAKRAAGVTMKEVAREYGISESRLFAVLRTKKDATVKPRMTIHKPDPREQASLAVVNQALASETAEDVVYGAAQEFARQMRRMGIQRLVIDLQQSRVEMTRTEIMNLPHGEAP